MMKKNLFLVALLCAYCTQASAWHVTFSENNTVATITSDAKNMPSSGDKDNFSGITYPEGVTNGGDLLKAATTLKFVATEDFPISTLGAFQSGGFAATTVDYSQATFSPLDEVSVTYYKYAPEEPGQKYSYNLSTKQYVTDSDGKYIQVTKTYHKNCMTFAYFGNLTKAVMSPTVEMLCQNCFQNNPNYHNAFEDESDPTTYLIPSSVKYIAAGAFDNIPINSITIPETVDYIESQAFKNGVIFHIIDVYVKGNTAAETNAFDKLNTVNQTVADGKFANLHFSPELAEMFVNANHELDLPTSLHVGKFQAWLTNHHSYAGNGWQEFISSSSGDPIPIPDGQTVVLRTFSDNVAHYVPTNFRAFIVNGVKSDGNDGYILLLQETFAIPANTGVIIYGEVRDNKSGFALPILSGASWQTNPYNRRAQSESVDNKTINLQNFLVPSTTSEHTTVNIAGPYVADAANENVVERNFIMAKYTNTTLNTGTNTVSAENDYIGFFRVLSSGILAKNLAYLQLPSAENTSFGSPTSGVKFTNPKGMEIIVDNTGIAFKPEHFEWHDAVSTGNWGQRPNVPCWVKSIGEPGEEEYFLSVNSLENTMEENGTIYTLQGVKVTNPQKGIYIKNGKKFIVK